VNEAFAAAVGLARPFVRGEPSCLIAFDGEDRMHKQADVERMFAELAEHRVDQERHIVVEDFEHRDTGRRGPRRERHFRRRRRALQEKRPRLLGDVGKLVRAAAFEIVGRDAGIKLEDKLPGDVAPAPGKDLAACLYCTRERLLIQGGSMFLTRAARQVFEQVHELLLHRRYRKDEFALTDLTGRPEFLDRFAPLDYSYNLGDTDFELRYQLAERPIKVAHFHLDRDDHRARFLDGGNSLGVFPLGERFERLLQRHGYLEPWRLPASAAAARARARGEETRERAVAGGLAGS